MTKVIISSIILALAGCTSMGEWRELQIDGSSEAAFDDSLSQLSNELPGSRSGMFALALVDIVRTESESTAQTDESDEAPYSYEDLRSQLDGLTYEDVIALADRTGPSISSLYSRQRSASGMRSGPYAQTDPHRFPPSTVIPMPSGPNSSWAP